MLHAAASTTSAKGSDVIIFHETHNTRPLTSSEWLSPFKIFFNAISYRLERRKSRAGDTREVRWHEAQDRHFQLAVLRWPRLTVEKHFAEDNRGDRRGEDATDADVPDDLSFVNRRGRAERQKFGEPQLKRTSPALMCWWLIETWLKCNKKIEINIRVTFIVVLVQLATLHLIILIDILWFVLDFR